MIHTQTPAKIRNGDIGEPLRRREVEPLEEPMPEPATTPAEPEKVPT